MGKRVVSAAVVILVIFVVLVLVGWLRVSSPSGDPTIRVDSQKVEEDTADIVQQSKNAIGSAAEKIDASIDREPAEVE